MTPEFLSRLQFALTASFHFIFPPISMGLVVLLVWMGWRCLRTGDPVWRQSSFFWVRIYGLVFSLVIATGIVQWRPSGCRSSCSPPPASSTCSGAR